MSTHADRHAHVETHAVGPDDVTVVETEAVPRREVAVDRVVTDTRAPAPPPETVPPHPLDGVGAVDEPVAPRVVTEDERVYVAEDGSLVRQVDRVEHEPPRRRRSSGLVPAMLVILALALGAIAAAWYLSRPTSKPVPTVEGLALDDAVARVQDKGFKTDIVSEPNAAQQGTVFRQQPSGGTKADKGSTVQLVVSKGPANVAVPNAVGLSETDARDRIVGAGFEVTSVKVFADADPGQVVAQSPQAGSNAAKGSSVRLNVSKGTRNVTVPTVVGMTESDAAAQVTSAGLKPNPVQVPSDQPPGTVVAQHPTAGQAERGSLVRLNVSKGP